MEIKSIAECLNFIENLESSNSRKDPSVCLDYLEIFHINFVCKGDENMLPLLS